MSVSTTSTDDADGASRATPVAAQAAADASSLEAVHTTHTANKRARLSRRALLAGGSGLVVVGGTAAGAIKYLHLYSRLRLKILHHFGIDDLPASHPHALPDGPMTTPRDIV
ncbi:MAG: hypothetical protein ACXVCO_00070, partial [Ktedonobacterales bacterium]